MKHMIADGLSCRGPLPSAAAACQNQKMAARVPVGRPAGSCNAQVRHHVAALQGLPSSSEPAAPG